MKKRHDREARSTVLLKPETVLVTLFSIWKQKISEPDSSMISFAYNENFFLSLHVVPNSFLLGMNWVFEGFIAAPVTLTSRTNSCNPVSEVNSQQCDVA
ncbi:unnamed protein product [Ceratitis capitata]|uniref:(Mediterranean fruit fly) hypothetical protein n=1 Tax=Ceratitis capitata TaxID=7213 RepID=A0A811URI0_CERCA|nr:unnamed protein product [Ceratitis capitata]